MADRGCGGAFSRRWPLIHDSFRAWPLPLRREMNVRAIFPRVFGVLLAFTLAMLDAHVGARDAEPAAQESVGSAEPLFLTVDPAKSQIHFSLESTLHTVHGTFRIKRG